MPTGFDLDSLAEELTPVKRLNANRVMLGLAVLTALGSGIVIAKLGFHNRFFDPAGTNPMYLIRGGLLLILGAASLSAVTGMAQPAVGSNRNGWRWAVAAALIVPIAAAVAALASRTPLADRLYPIHGVECLTYSIGIGLVLGAVITWWLRRGAATSPERAGTLTGLAAGSLGTLAYSMHCPHSDIVYIGLWYTLTIAVAMLAGRLIVPRMIRW